MPAARGPPRHTALAALPALALDLETTGLDVANDRIVQIGAVGMRGPTVLGEPRIDTLVDPGIPIPAASARIHRITDSDVAGSPRLPELLESLVEMFAGRVVVGQNVRFDLAVLRHEAARAGVPWRDPPVLDVSHLAGALDRSLVDLSLDSLANRFGITIEARHDALGDSLAAAGIFSALVPRLREADVRTLGERRRRSRLAARIVSNEVRALTARAAAIAAARLETEGYGPAPAPWCVLVLGSGGRGESLLSADQDNALVHAGSDGDDAWFAALGAGLADLLDEAGVRRCQGGIMAANAEWRGSVPVWRERVDGWLRRSAPEDLLHVDIFYDLVPVAGAIGLGRDLHTAAVDAAGRTPAFIALLAESVAAMSPAIGLFGRLRTSEGRVDLKLGGLLPLVGTARTLALRIGSRARSTPERIQDAGAAGRVSSSDAETLVRIHRSLLTMILEQQIEDLATGVSPSGRIEVRRLSRSDRRALVRDLRILDDTLEVLRSSIARS